ncbi:SigB/SigF/SigG family RNA polymerase sigma factor [Streptomyces sp. NPDC005551]|uniref:RNA polymerase sigma factor SigF n=1 Tax=Streptomyces sp. NPDC005551 TaxID=3364725 RepID=UPI003678548E
MSASTAPPQEDVPDQAQGQERPRQAPASAPALPSAPVQPTAPTLPTAPARPPAPGQSAPPTQPSAPGQSATGQPPAPGRPGTAEEQPAPAPEKRRGADTRALTQVLFGQLKNLEPGSPEHGRVRGALIEANLPLVRYAAARFRSRNEPMEDVVQVGTIGLINAIDRFDPDRGVQFPTFAMPTVVGEIKRYFRDNVRTVHVPRRLHELWVQVNSATEDLTTAFGRSPTTAEIAGRLRISEEEVLSCIEAGRSYHATSLEAAQEGDGLPGLLDRLGYEDPALDGVEHRDLVRHLLVQLPEREQRILLLRYYSNLTQSQISAELGVSQMHVSRLLARSFARLRSANRIEA